MKKGNRQSTIITVPGYTVLQMAVTILCTTERSMGPTEIAEFGIRRGWVRIPRGRTRGYVAQTLQTKLQANATGELSKSLVYRPKNGKYRARVCAY
jgi:hypothetical protein